ncbi:sugar phosphate isomerase/epimerase [Streptomyces himastatinicus ATCC 53653]|uniref:Sugar phosphate isomerase/epimerase n=1 Tax=Streptomyces himastatinicus ATCC 53653 TaxID=457427 RepID=D9W849_9ACTN|nr:sugar phosphate isomerase/epimerase [Streptomyces himastatinicus]EFL20583.1 sugar phosphate isomerase/epimerase [Streptomyces himastatinicus ATCC 53653]
MTAEDLLATCWTTAGDAAPGRDDQRSPLTLRERAEAAGAAGFTGFGLLYADLVEAERAYGLAGIRSLLEDNGLVHLELELLVDWWADGPRRAASDAVRRDLLRTAEALGAHHIKIGPDVEDRPWDPDAWAEEFAALAAEADGVGARLGIEFLPWSNLKTVHDGLRLVEAACHPAGGLIIDVWHTERAHTPPADLAGVPRSRIVGVELNDADCQVVGTLFEDTVRRRRLCGEGSFALPDIIAALRATGWSGPWGVEILSDAHRALPVREAADVAYRTALEVLHPAR